MKLKEKIKNMKEKIINFLVGNKKSNKIKLDILGISYTKNEDQPLYIVILGENDGERKVPVIINYFEAQAIAIEIEKILPIVPLIYDAFKYIINDHKIKFDEILISDFKNDILLTHLTSKKEKIEIRTADALAISVRMGYPIYIYDDVLTKVDEIVKKYYDIKNGSQVLVDKGRLHGFTIGELNGLLQKAIDDEEYEKASEIRDEIIKKKRENSEDQ